MPTSLRSFVRLAVEMGPDPIYDEMSTNQNPDDSRAVENSQEAVTKKNKKGTTKSKKRNKSDAVYNEEGRHSYSYIINPLRAHVRDKIPPPPIQSEKSTSANNTLLRNKMVLTGTKLLSLMLLVFL